MIYFLIAAAALLLILLHDLFQKKHAILRNFPLVGHLRYLLERVGPELRQYIVTNNNEERPFSRDQRRWVYSSSKKQNNYFGFGSDNNFETTKDYLIYKHSAFPLAGTHPGEPGYDDQYRIPAAKVLGGYRERTKQFRPSSIINVSGMSFGSLSSAAIRAINEGCSASGCLHNTGEGGVSPYHLKGGELIWQIGTGYFGCRAEDGGFSLPKLLETVDKHPQIRAIELKLSQGAKPGLGGVLPGAKVTPEIASIRGIPVGKDCLSPNGHRAFSDIDEMLDLVEEIAAASGLPVGIKSAVGDLQFWHDLAKLMASTDRAVDFIAVDGGEGGTGAGPLVFSDHVSLPFRAAFKHVYLAMAEQDLQDHIVFIGAGKLGFPESALLACGMGCDMIAVAREALLAIGCIQAQKCETGKCPTGVTTHNKWLVRGLDPTDKGARLANYLITLRKEIKRLCHAGGVAHPAMITLDHFEIMDGPFSSRNAREVFGYTAYQDKPGPNEDNYVNNIFLNKN
ncbi:MAG: FMN-binding glutamate synthase family protein [Bacteroidota bacterium]